VARKRKKKVPVWLPLSLLLLLGALLVVVLVDSRIEREPARMVQQPVPATPVSQQPEVAFEDFRSIPEAPAALSDVPPSSSAKAPPLPQVQAGISLVLDDVGYDLPALKRILKLPIEVAIAIIPDAPHAREAAEMAHRAGQMVMLHLPMEPDTPKYRDAMTDAFLRVGMNEEQLRATFLHDLEQVPYVQGVNNHMGSHLTRLEAPMRAVMQLCRERGLFFIDSRTAGDSVAAKTAAEAGVDWAARQVFLDNQLDEASLRKSWNKALACASKGHTCVVIAHPHPETVDFLADKLGKGDWQRLLPISAMLHLQATGDAS